MGYRVQRPTFARQLARKLIDGGTLADVRAMITLQLEKDDAEDALDDAIREEVQNEAFNKFAPLAKQIDDEEKAALAERRERWAREDAERKAASV